MLCPRCRNEWDVSKNSCQLCGFSPYTAIQPEKIKELEELGRKNSQDEGAFHQSDSSSQRSEPFVTTRSLLSGSVLRGGRYSVQSLLERQNWSSGAFEATWVGYDFHQAKQIMICEVVIPGGILAQTQAIMHTATISLLSVNRHPHIAPLLDAFSDQGRSFFIFGHIDGETLLDRLRRLQSPLSEQEVVEFCIQMVDTLEVLGQKSRPVIHGLIRPKHVYLPYNSAQYVLSNFSILVAGGAIQFLRGAGRSHLSPYTAPEFTRGIVDRHSDLYSVLATAYHLATSNIPLRLSSERSVLHAQALNPAVSPAFDAILAKGLSFVPHQRYQHPSHLRQDLLALRSHTASNSFVRYNDMDMLTTLSSRGNMVLPLTSGATISGSPHPFPIAPTVQDEEEVSLLPSPETLPPMRIGNDRFEGVVVIAVVLLIMGIITLLSNFHV